MKTITVTGVTYLLDPNIYNAFILMSQNLEGITRWVDEQHQFENAAPLRYPFVDQPVRLCGQMGGPMIFKPLKELLSLSDGIIISLAGRILDLKYLESQDLFPEMLKKVARIVSETSLPIVFAIEDNKDSFEPIFLSGNKEIVAGMLLEQVLEKPPSSIVVEDDIWESSSHTIMSIRRILNISKIVPIIPYTYRKPITLQNIMTTLITEMNID